eukprot:13392029-Alexandrium_andersonii.AAC.1
MRYYTFEAAGKGSSKLRGRHRPILPGPRAGGGCLVGVHQVCGCREARALGPGRAGRAWWAVP